MRPRNDSDDSGLVDPAGWVGNISNPIRAGGWEGGRTGRRQLKALKLLRLNGRLWMLGWSFGLFFASDGGDIQILHADQRISRC